MTTKPEQTDIYECVIRSGKPDQGWCFASPPGANAPEVFVHISKVASRDARAMQPGAWIRCKVVASSRRSDRLEATEAEFIDQPPIEMQVARLERLYGPSCTDPASYRLDGYTQKEARELRERRCLTDAEYFAGMSMNGLRGIVQAKDRFFAADREALVVEALRRFHESKDKP